jgi:hypothetical protein
MKLLWKGYLYNITSTRALTSIKPSKGLPLSTTYFNFVIEKKNSNSGVEVASQEWRKLVEYLPQGIAKTKDLEVV